MVAITGIIGPQVATDGNQSTPARQDKTGALVHTVGRAQFAEPTSRGLIFAACIPPGTGQAPGTAIGTTGCFTLANPATAAGSAAKNLVIIQINVGYISGTLGAGTLALLSHTSTSGAITAPTGGTAITPTSGLIGSTTVATVANCRFNNTVPATGIQIRTIATFGAGLASTATFPSMLTDNVNGMVLIPPGTAVSVQGIMAAGTSPLIVVGMIWMEELA